MSNEPQPIVVDIGAAAAMLEASPQLAAMMNEMIGGPALVAAQAEIERLRAALEKISDPLVVPTEGVGLAKAISTIAALAKIARDALEQ